MLKSRTAYPITETNADLLHHISGIELTAFTANIGWCATFSEVRYPRWSIEPMSVVVNEQYFTIDTESYP